MLFLDRLDSPFPYTAGESIDNTVNKMIVPYSNLIRSMICVSSPDLRIASMSARNFAAAA
jgi:hypothetical protein